MADDHSALLSIAQATAGHVELAKATSLRTRLESHSGRMSSDAKEILWAIVRAHEDAAREMVESAQRA